MCLNYLFSCRARGKQSTDKTADRFIYRWNNYKMEARKAESGDMKNVKQKFYKVTFCKIIIKVLEDIEARLIDKT